MIGQTTGHRWSQQHFSALISGPGRPATQFMMIMVGEGIAPSTTTPEPDMIVSHHPALQCMVTCD